MTNQEYYEELCEKAEKFDRYRIHDLTKNPDDLPEEYENVLIYGRAEATGEVFAFSGYLVFANGEIFEPYRAILLGWARFPRWED